MSVFFMDFDMAPSVIWARDLYDQMQIRSDFRKWFPRMCQYGFVEGRDYEFVPRVRPQDEGGRTVQRYVKDYRITLEMAKQLYKLHHFHKNDCFRSCEGQHCMGTDHWMQAVIELLHQHKCKSHAPPKRFYESQPPDSLVTTTQIAKEYGCGAKVFNRLLHLHGIQYRANNQWVLYAKHIFRMWWQNEYQSVCGLSAERKCRTCCVSVTFISVFDGTSFSGDRTKLSAGVFYQVVYIGHTRDDSETVGRASTEEFPWPSIWCR